MFFHVIRIFQESHNAVENVAFPHTLWSNGSSLIDLSCLFKLQWDLPVPLSNASLHTNFSLAGKHFLSATALDSIIVNQEHMVFLSLATPPLPTTSTATAAVTSATHALSPSPFLSPSLQIRAAEVYCYFTWADAAKGGAAQAGYLVNGALLWAGDTSWSSPIFLISVSTHHIGKQLYYKLVRSLWHWQMCCLDSVEARQFPKLSVLAHLPSADTLTTTHILIDTHTHTS